MSVREIWERRQAAAFLVSAGLVLAVVIGSTGFSIVQGNSLRECNKRVIVSLQDRTSYSATLQKLDDQRNTALLNILRASGSSAQAQAFIAALKVDQEWKQSRLALLAVFDPQAPTPSQAAVAEAIKSYTAADIEQKRVAAERDKIKLPKLSECL